MGVVVNKQTACLIVLLLSIPLSSSCAATQRDGRREAPTPISKSTPEEKQKVSITELKRLYGSATSEFERRAICLRAIDEGVIFRTGPISSIDEIFGTKFAADLPTKREIKRIAVIDFAVETKSAPSDDTVARGHSGWFMVIEYDYNGDIQNYYLTNLHK